MERLNGVEPSKVVCSGRKKSALRRFALIHLPSITITLVLLSFYTSNLQWAEPTNEQLNALQFAAKAHEASVLVSLTDILLHRICYGLIEDGGIPLGFISSPFHLGSPIQYLVSWELWGVLLKPAANRLLHQMTGILIILISLLAISLGPLSAIIMIPRQGWSFFDSDWNTWCVNGLAFETNLDSRHAWNALGTIQLGDYGYGTTDVFLGNITHSAFYFYNLEWRYISLFADFAPTQPDVLITATCPMDLVAMSLHNYVCSFQSNTTEWLVRSAQKRADSPDLLKWKQPSVSVSCSDAQMDKGTAAFKFNSKVLNDTISLNVKNTSPLKDLNEVETPPGPVSYRFLNINHITSQPISASILVLKLSLCIISAHWVQADIWIEKKANVIQSHLDLPIDDGFERSNGSLSTGDLIRMGDGWFTGIDFPDITPSNSAYQQILRFCGNNHGFFENCLPMSLAAHLADALSGTPYSAYTEAVHINEKDPQNYTIIHNTVYNKPFMYNFLNSRAIPCAFAILILHIIIVLVHIATILLSSHPWHSSSWGSVGQMLILALRSTSPSSLGKVGGGVESSQTWTATARVRAVGENQQLEIVLGDSDGTEEEGQCRQQIKDASARKDKQGVRAGIHYS
ncbi:hypothetical protein BGZ61DRAFT_354905 [Ilyonectria robusta]|uniref:uncharacterized protein n=1 Tax=Ilyonectria robusta TaxID=1079257 RepID=UPI001E8E29DA|nr:uncharacterized protein BGZ61DRAFT_354905 [Ilyonectria robusta]KAH8686234.1 hypothetical protein BGZ61DRAFT_354905 [Ilyonectria robusta]